MRAKLLLLLLTMTVCRGCPPALAAEGSSIAGPIGGTDIRSALLPPPGLYGGTVLFYGEAREFFDGNGKPVPALNALQLTRTRAGPFLLYVPGFQVAGGSIGIAGMVPAGTECGRLFESTPASCIAGVGDPYVEVAWSRFFGFMRPSQYPGAYPIAEGLAILLGVGVVFPEGRYSATDAATRGLAIGNNIWDIAPTVAITYTTKPILAEGTEISAKLYWNSYRPNPANGYATGSLANIDFAVTERIGRFQAGVAGYYVLQAEDDHQFGTLVPPDGRRVETAALGGVLAYDMPEHGASLKIKALATIQQHNTVSSRGIAIGWVKKF